MLKSLFALVCVFLLSGAGSARAQNDAAQHSPVLASGRACLDRLVDQGRKRNYDVEQDGVDSLILDPSRDNIQLLQQSVTNCMDAAFPTMEVVTRPGSNAKSRAWYAAVDGQYVWCATSTLTDELDDVQVFGGDGPKKTWFAVRFSCASGNKVLGWYEPADLTPAEAKAGPPVNSSNVEPSAAAPQGASRPETADCSQAAVHWSSAESIGARQAYQDHLARFPTCGYATLAKVRIAAIDQGIAPPARTAPQVTTRPQNADCSQAAANWATTESIGTRQAYQDHLARFPTCGYATLAKVRIAAIDQGIAPPAAPDAIAKTCPAGQVRDSDGDCVRAKRAPKNAGSRSERISAPPRPRASANDSGSLPPHALNCSDPSQVMACANKALSTLPH